MAFADRIKAVEARIAQIEATLSSVLDLLEQGFGDDDSADPLTSLDGEAQGEARDQTEGL